ncbi:hypothetical protein, partial [uncultured Alistipes sp.]|uniref:hypothetical protein n=1 Tax=uncultured Alistipes sp. TaxID=538949 RepID=UPI00267073BB
HTRTLWRLLERHRLPVFLFVNKLDLPGADRGALLAGLRALGFGIICYINHYPDFIVRLKSGMTVLVETKGDQLDNSDSRNKVELGTTWANKAGKWYRYFMVFDKQQMDGAITVGELLERLKEM